MGPSKNHFCGSGSNRNKNNNWNRNGGAYHGMTDDNTRKFRIELSFKDVGSSSNNNNGNCSTSANNVAFQNLGPTMAALRHNAGISVAWSPEEVALLNVLLVEYASDPNFVRYSKIAEQMNDKTSRDVLLFCKSMSEMVTKSLPKSSQGGPPYAQSMVMPMESDDGICFRAIDGTTGQLLEQNAQALDQISANFASFRIYEKIHLFCQARNNILTILNDSLSNLPEGLEKMPPLPVKLNEELANHILPGHRLPRMGFTDPSYYL